MHAKEVHRENVLTNKRRVSVNVFLNFIFCKVILEPRNYWRLGDSGDCRSFIADL